MQHDGGMDLAPTEVLTLLTIRSLRDLGDRHAQVPGAVPRQIAVILLDAAIERAAFAACDSKQLSLPERAHLDDALKKLRAAGWKPGRGTEANRERMHRVRNLVQHAGVGVDADELTMWVVTARQTLAALVDFGFDVAIDAVRYSSALHDDTIADAFERAEEALAAGQSQTAMGQTAIAFDAAFRTWDRYVRDAHPGLNRASSFRLDGSDMGNDPRVESVSKLAAISAISVSPGEAMWFERARQDAAVLDEREVQRALAFVFAFSAAVEASPAMIMEDRQRRRDEAARRVRESPAGVASIMAFEIVPRDPADIVVLTLQDVPPSDAFPGWLQELHRQLYEKFHWELNVSASPDGTVTIPLSDDIGTTIELVADALRDAEAALQSAKTKAADHAAAIAHALTEMNAAIAAAVPAGAPEWIALTARQLENGRGIVVELTVDHPTIEAWSAREAVREAAGVNVWGYGAALEVEAGVDDIARVIPAILQRLKELADEATAIHRAREAARDAATQLLIAKGISLKG